MEERFPLTVLVAAGRCPVEFVMLDNGECPGQEFLENECEQIREGGKDKPQSTARARFLVLFNQMAIAGQLPPKRFKKEMQDLSAFSHEVRNIQIRYPCFRDGPKWIITHGFVKPGAKKGLGAWPSAEVQRAEEIRAVYSRRKLEQERANKKGKK